MDARLRALREIWIATASPGGRPDATPVWFWWDGQAVYFTCAAVALQARNIDHEPEVVVHYGDGSDPIIINGIVYRVRPRLVSAWSYATVSTRTDWIPGQ